MRNKELAKRIIKKYGEAAQKMQMVEESAELAAALCRLNRGRFVEDHVAEEVADCLAVLEQMEVLYDPDCEWKKQYVNPDDDDNRQLISLLGFVQMLLPDESEAGEHLFTLLRARLEALSEKIGIEKIEAWRVKKSERMVERLEMEGK